jgi:hypothetical protein
LVKGKICEMIARTFGRTGATCAAIELTAARIGAIFEVISGTCAPTGATYETTFAMATAAMRAAIARISAPTGET